VQVPNQQNARRCVRKKCLVLLVLGCLVLGVAYATGENEGTGTQYIRMYYPVGVAGPLSKLMEDMVADFNKSQDGIKVESVFAGGYAEVLEKTRTAFLAGNPPELAVLDGPTLLDMLTVKAIIPLDEYIKAEGPGYMDSFTPGFFEIAKNGGKIWSIPWQRSTPLFYYNKDFFREAGLDQNKPPATWDEVIAMSQKLVVRDTQGKVKRWGIEIPVNWWLLKPFILQAGGTVDSEDGKKLAIDTPEMREALGYMKKLADLGVMPAVKQWAESGSDFAAGATAMLYNSTGALTFIADSTKFDFGTAFLPRHKKQVVIEGGGNFFIVKTNTEKQIAAWKFINWMVKPENTARWSIGSGYIPVRKAAFEVPIYKEYTAQRPQAMVAYRQLMEVEVQRNMMLYNDNAANKTMISLIEKVMSGADMEKSIKEAQAEANQNLKDFN